MGEIIKLLRQQIDLCRSLLLATERQRQALCGGSGDSMSRETKRIEKRQALLLKGTATKNLAELLSRTALSEERTTARQLLQEADGLMREMREAVAMNDALLDRHMQFILFNINVMAGTPAEATYTAKDMKKGKKRTGADTKVFDASV